MLSRILSDKSSMRTDEAILGKKKYVLSDEEKNLHENVPKCYHFPTFNVRKFSVFKNLKTHAQMTFFKRFIHIIIRQKKKDAFSNISCRRSCQLDGA